MRYVIWGPIIGLSIGCLLFYFGIFEANVNLFINATVVLMIIGLAVGWFADSKNK
jgi:uncharacterized membrane protein